MKVLPVRRSSGCGTTEGELTVEHLYTLVTKS